MFKNQTHYSVRGLNMHVIMEVISARLFFKFTLQNCVVGPLLHSLESLKIPDFPSIRYEPQIKTQNNAIYA